MASADHVFEAEIRKSVRRELIDILGLPGTGEDVVARLAGDAFIGSDTVASIAGISIANIYRRIKDAGDDFPRPVKVDGRSLWLVSEVRAWIDRRVRQSRRVGTLSEPAAT
jgi:predicted DNA-binding transcriptional regulator AlpA